MSSIRSSGSITENIPALMAEEQFSRLYFDSNLIVERIVSHGHTTVWMQQSWDEWVIVWKGSALIEIEGEACPKKLDAGSYLHIPAGCRHRVVWTVPDDDTLWLAVHSKPSDIQAETYELWRQDDNGGEYLVESSSDRGALEKMKGVLESKLHRQIYWITSKGDKR